VKNLPFQNGVGSGSERSDKLDPEQIISDPRQLNFNIVMLNKSFGCFAFHEKFLFFLSCPGTYTICSTPPRNPPVFVRGSYSDALSHFHAAVDADPNNYMSYYKRATVYMALSRSRPALADLDKILEIKPDFLKVLYL
jgi:tetratricopeptide (TPR) repeat protein